MSFERKKPLSSQHGTGYSRETVTEVDAWINATFTAVSWLKSAQDMWQYLKAHFIEAAIASVEVHTMPIFALTSRGDGSLKIDRRLAMALAFSTCFHRAINTLVCARFEIDKVTKNVPLRRPTWLLSKV